MTDFREALLEFHAAHTREQLKSIAAYNALCEENEGNDTFVNLRDEITRINDALEGALRRAKSDVDEVMAVLVTMKSFARNPKKLDTCRELVERRYASTWSADQMSYFEVATVKLKTWLDYFLSFTSYNPWAPDAINPVNLVHRETIGAGAGLLVERPAAVEHNLLAKAIDNWLSYKNLRGYFWEKHQDPAEVVVDRLSQEASETFAFIQILQSALFKRDPSKQPSYCLLEYNAANSDPSRILVLLVEPFADLIKLEQLEFEEFEEWYTGLTARTHLEVRPVGSDNATNELEHIGEVVKKQLDRAWQKLLTGAPV